jgi:RimJ/RimL family protein N-acetyltransferase
MELIPIQETLEENAQFVNNSLCKDTIVMTIEFYKKVGFVPPWIGYYVSENNMLVGSAAFKGPPVNGSVEIAYGTMEAHQHAGIGTAICKKLVDLARVTDPTIKITARTMSNENFSAKILLKNQFVCFGTVQDPEDGEVWEWIFKG